MASLTKKTKCRRRMKDRRMTKRRNTTARRNIANTETTLDTVNRLLQELSESK